MENSSNDISMKTRGSKTIDLYTWATPNGRKVSIMLEELGLDYNVIPIDITKGEQHDLDFVSFSQNNKIPAIIDHETGLKMMESGAILMYLAKKTGLLMSQTDGQYWEEMQWLMFQMGGIGPMQVQAHVFYRYAPEKIEYAIGRYQRETRRLYEVLDRQLRDNPYLAGEFSIADIACWPWVRIHNWAGVELTGLDHLERWIKDLYARPAFQKGICVPYKVERGKETLDESRKRGSKMLV